MISMISFFLAVMLSKPSKKYCIYLPTARGDGVKIHVIEESKKAESCAYFFTKSKKAIASKKKKVSLIRKKTPRLKMVHFWLNIGANALTLGFNFNILSRAPPGRGVKLGDSISLRRPWRTLWSEPWFFFRCCREMEIKSEINAKKNPKTCLNSITAKHEGWRSRWRPEEAKMNNKASWDRIWLSVPKLKRKDFVALL